MNQELQKQLAALIEKAAAAGQSAWDFASEQAPEVIQQLLAWKFTEALGIALVCLVVAVFSALMIRKGIKDLKGPFSNGELLVIVFSVVLGASALIGTGGVFDAAKIKIAPKVYLIEYISKKAK